MKIARDTAKAVFMVRIPIFFGFTQYHLSIIIIIIILDIMFTNKLINGQFNSDWL